ncbi:MAG TPA: GNAT family N-acetyltransferase [Marmoricola sp.]|nr:GNAT family N-acetyltransferase [Marmoricola sp.]
MACDLEFLDEAAEFLAAAAPLLAAEPLRCTVIASVAARTLRADAPRADTAPGARWWLVVRDADGAVLGAGMRQFPLPPFPVYLAEMPDQAAVLLARALHERGEDVRAIDGFVPTIDVFAGELAALSGRAVEPRERMSLYEVVDLVEPPMAAGTMRIADAEDGDLVHAWLELFSADASEQAGRIDPHPSPIETRESVGARIDAGQVWLWLDEAGVPVHVTAFSPPSNGVARVGPVFTPKEHRGHGYAASAVAEVSRYLRGEGARVCLFADRDNPVSSALYVRLGYRAVATTGSVRLV